MLRDTSLSDSGCNFFPVWPSSEEFLFLPRVLNYSALHGNHLGQKVRNVAKKLGEKYDICPYFREKIMIYVKKIWNKVRNLSKFSGKNTKNVQIFGEK